MSHRFSRPRRTAQALVELALVLPLFMLIVCAIVDFARVFNAQETLHRLTKEAVAAGARLRADGTRPTTAEVQTLLQSTVLPPLVPAQVVVNLVDNARKDAKGRRSVFVDVSYNVPLLTPMMDRFFPAAQARLDSVAQLPYPYVRPTKATAPPPFVINPDGTIQPLVEMDGAMKVLGKQLQYGAGGPMIPVTMKMQIEKEKDKNEGKTHWKSIFGDKPVNGGETMSLGRIKPDEILEFSARAKHTSGSTVLFDATYDSAGRDPFQDAASQYHVMVLKNGDPAPDKEPYGNQAALTTYIEPYVNTATKTMKMGKNEAVILWEFNPQYESTAADFQDLAIWVQLTPRD